MRKYPPLFERIQTEPEKEGKLIREIQREYEKFWRGISKKVEANSERTLAMRDMQTSCMWVCRAIAVNGFKPDEPTPITTKIIIKAALDLLDHHQEPLNPVLAPSKIIQK